MMRIVDARITGRHIPFGNVSVGDAFLVDDRLNIKINGNSAFRLGTVSNGAVERAIVQFTLDMPVDPVRTEIHILGYETT